MSDMFKKLHITDKHLLAVVWLLSTILIIFSADPQNAEARSTTDLETYLGPWVHSINRGALAVAVIYFLLPKYFYKGRYLLFAILLAATFFIFGSIEEGILELIFFPDTKGIDKWTLPGIYVFVSQSLTLLAIMLAVKLAWDYRLTQEKLILLQAEKVESELKFLRSQINPHILFNALNNIYSHSLTNSGLAPDMLLKLSDLLRYTLYECSDKRASLDRELKCLENYVALQEMGLEGRGSVSLRIKGNSKGKFILPFVFITLVENCFKHSFDTQEGDILIDIHIVIEDTALTLTTKNSFNPDNRTGAEAKTEKGLGVANVKRRLELIYEDQFSLDYGPEDNFFILKLRLPLEHHSQFGRKIS